MKSLSTHFSQIAEMTAQGFTARQIAATIGFTPGTVKVYRSRLYAELGLRADRDYVAQITRWWIENHERAK